MTQEIYNDLCPYCDAEINAAMRRIAASEYFPVLSAFVYPNRSVEEVRAQICAYTTIDEFQLQVMKTVNEQVIARSTTGFSYSGLDKLDKAQRYLLVANHRDIMLDATLLQYALCLEGHRTSEITFGSNLMRLQVVIDIGKSNKMFKVIRGGNIRDFYRNSLDLSEYIRYTLLEKRESVWIAQRNGRTKDGKDATDQGIVKMFYMSSPKNPAQALADLNIVPISISYEHEPCDFLKAKELYFTQKNGRYEKQPGEDLNSILTGLMQPKGQVHLHFGEPLAASDLQPLSGLPNNKFNQQVALLIDKQVLNNYKIFNTSYIAHDLRSGKAKFSDKYTAKEKADFIDRMNQGLSKVDGDKNELQEIFLGIYANSVGIFRK
jgi:hypothetical protein